VLLTAFANERRPANLGSTEPEQHGDQVRFRSSTKQSGRRPVVAIIGTRGYPSYYGGFETAVRRIAPDLVDRGWDVRVYGRRAALRADDPGLDPRVESVVTSGLDSKSLSTLTYGLTSVLHALLKKPDVALVMNVANGFWLPLLRLRGVPTVVNVDGIEWQRDKWSRLGKAVFRWGARFTARFADELVFDAEAIASFWRREFGRTGTFIPYGGERILDTTRDETLTPGCYVLLVARFVPENSIDVFLEAAPTIVDKCDVDVVLVGAAPPGDPIQAKAADLARTDARIHLMGHISDDRRLFGLWQDAGVYFHGHTVGGTNPALVQAMALGSRVVARDTVYNREVLADTGHFCDGTPESIVDAVVAAFNDDRDLERLTGERAAAHYSWQLVCDRYAGALAGQLPAPRRSV
jgi:glycosyltransferase involved in cell wall biosynthesis